MDYDTSGFESIGKFFTTLIANYDELFFPVEEERKNLQKENENKQNETSKVNLSYLDNLKLSESFFQSTGDFEDLNENTNTDKNKDVLIENKTVENVSSTSGSSPLSSPSLPRYRVSQSNLVFSNSPNPVRSIYYPSQLSTLLLYDLNTNQSKWTKNEATQYLQNVVGYSNKDSL